MHSIETQKQVITMLAQRQSIRSIAEDLKISPTTVSQWNREFASEIAETHRQELETVLDDLHATKLQRVRALARAFKKIELYLQTSDNVHKDYKLVTLLLRLDKYINQEIVNDTPPAPTEHVCPDQVFNFLTDMPDPALRSTQPASDATPDPNSVASQQPGTASAPASDADQTVSGDAANTAPDQALRDNDSQIGNAIEQRSMDKLASPARRVLSIRVDRNRNVTVSKTTVPIHGNQPKNRSMGTITRQRK